MSSPKIYAQEMQKARTPTEARALSTVYIRKDGYLASSDPLRQVDFSASVSRFPSLPRLRVARLRQLAAIPWNSL